MRLFISLLLWWAPAFELTWGNVPVGIFALSATLRAAIDSLDPLVTTTQALTNHALRNSHYLLA